MYYILALISFLVYSRYLQKDLWSKMWMGLFTFFFCAILLVLHLIHDASGWSIEKSELQLERLNG